MAQDAPHWAPNAVATEAGWTDPKTGELLVAVQGLLAVEETPKKKSKKTTVVVEETPAEDTPVIE